MLVEFCHNYVLFYRSRIFQKNHQLASLHEKTRGEYMVFSHIEEWRKIINVRGLCFACYVQGEIGFDKRWQTGREGVCDCYVSDRTRVRGSHSAQLSASTVDQHERAQPQPRHSLFTAVDSSCTWGTSA